jgi:hypothetical protein
MLKYFNILIRLLVWGNFIDFCCRENIKPLIFFSCHWIPCTAEELGHQWLLCWCYCCVLQVTMQSNCVPWNWRTCSWGVACRKQWQGVKTRNVKLNSKYVNQFIISVMLLWYSVMYLHCLWFWINIDCCVSFFSVPFICTLVSPATYLSKFLPIVFCSHLITHISETLHSYC